MIFADKNNFKEAQAFIVAEKEVLFEIKDFTIADGLIALITSYYAFFVSYPKPSPAVGVLLFIQEIILEIPDETTKKKKYVNLINSVID